MDIDTQIAELLLTKKAVKVEPRNPFTWTSGIVSPIYCDNRILIAFPDARKIIIDAFLNKIKELGWQCDAIAGTATSGIAWAAILAERLELPMVYVRSRKKRHGAGKQVEGGVVDLMRKRFLLVEDLFSTGGSSIESANALKIEMKADVIGILAIFEYGFRMAEENFKHAGYFKSALTNVKTLLKVSEIYGEDLESVLSFLIDPEKWDKTTSQTD